MIYLVDAAFSKRSGAAGIAVINRTRFVCADVIRCSSANEAELLGVLRAMEIISRSERHAEVWTDSTYAERHGRRHWLLKKGVTIRKVPRAEVHSAHIAARQTLKAWQAGRGNHSTWVEPRRVEEVLAELAQPSEPTGLRGLFGRLVGRTA